MALCLFAATAQTLCSFSDASGQPTACGWYNVEGWLWGLRSGANPNALTGPTTLGEGTLEAVFRNRSVLGPSPD